MPSDVKESGAEISSDGKKRCWFAANNELYHSYHDEEWGVPCADDRQLFEALVLEGMQCGLSWSTILKKRDNFRDAFDGFDIHKVAEYTKEDVQRLLENEGIIRHKRKIESAINNAKRAIELQEEFGSIAAFVWQFEPMADSKSRPKVFNKTSLVKITKTEESEAMSKEFKKRKWSFLGPTTCYAFMQSVGIVNDHVESCEFRERCNILREKFLPPKPQ